MRTNFFRKRLYLVPVLMLLLFIGVYAEEVRTPSIVTVEILRDGLSIRSSVIDFQQVVGISLDGNYLAGDLLKEKVSLNNNEIRIPMELQHIENIKGCFLEISLKSGVTLSIPMLEFDPNAPKKSENEYIPQRVNYAAGVFEVDSNISPTSSGCVNQNYVTATWGYQNEGGAQNGWYFCGQAAVSTAINYLRQGYVSYNTKLSQLQWFHDELKHHQGDYQSITNPHREANIDALFRILYSHKRGEFNVPIPVKTGDDRQAAINAMLRTLSYRNRYIIALSQKYVGSSLFGHYYVVYKINYNPASSTLGTIYFADPYNGSRYGSMAFSSFLTKMRNAGTIGRYSYLELYNK